ncbi:DUF2892 domain-containing protein [Caldimonas tepidiphila]|uniref:DUF2892 domain-containing protein n=1 Tax=Caldimonas tepidiphila TaxID=2315841 RepID=UPI000E5BAD18|nr:DUF2892 domain-containing protein [Caldimonas tepidiphila]
MKLVATTASRVSDHTAPPVNDRIAQRTEARIAYAAYAGHVYIDQRLEELDREWDIERVLQANASALSIAGVLLGTFVNRRWYALPAGVAGFLLQHAVQGWCPPLPLLRRLGVRTAEEINRERYALKALRGDFEGITARDGITGLGMVLQATRPDHATHL